MPDDADPGPEEYWQWEHWRLVINPMAGFKLKDWRELAAGSILEEDDNLLFWPVLENLLADTGAEADRAARIGDFAVRRRDGYSFTCEIDGDVECGKDEAGEAIREDWQLLDEFPFVSAEVGVPLNAADAVATARAIAAREIGLTEAVRTTLRPYNPEAWTPKYESKGRHTVTLETPWRAGGGGAT